MAKEDKELNPTNRMLSGIAVLTSICVVGALGVGGALNASKYFNAQSDVDMNPSPDKDYRETAEQTPVEQADAVIADATGKPAPTGMQ